MDRRKIFRMIASVAIALALWVYVINVVNPTSSTIVKNVPVQLTGTDVLFQNNLAIQGDGEYTVDLVVSAPRTELGNLSADLFTATGDVSGLTLGQDYITVSVKSPNGIGVTEIRSRKIQVYVDELVKKTVPVQFEYASAGDNKETTVVSVDPFEVELSGAKSLMEKLGGYVVKIDNSLLKSEDISNLTLVGEARDKSGNRMKGINCASESINVAATIYSTKTVDLNVNYGGDVWYGVNLNGVSVPETIDIKGPVDTLSWISSVYTEYINLYGIYEDLEETIVPYMADGVYVCDNSKNLKLVADVTDEGKIEFDFYAWEIFVKNLGADLSYDALEVVNGDYVTVCVQGNATVLKTVSRDDISLFVNANGLVGNEHTLKIQSETNIDGVKITISPSQVKIKIR